MGRKTGDDIVIDSFESDALSLHPLPEMRDRLLVIADR
jgi:hypothetical protein